MLKTESFDYHDGDLTLKGFIAYDDTREPCPGILIAHDWGGLSEFTRNKAKKLAELGYVGFALDMFGNGKTGQTKEEKGALIQPFMQNRALMQQRMLAAFEAIQKIKHVNPNQIGAIGFCFGGACVLDLARTGANVKASVSFHGLLGAPDNIPHPHIQSRILALHGFDDPMVTPDQAVAFGEEMTRAKADWQLNIYGNTMHAFTNPQANDPGFGTVYNQKADERSWIAMQNFFKETFEV
jgi:dienelactone hydrolase